jgi:hypothetical protein
LDQTQLFYSSRVVYPNQIDTSVVEIILSGDSVFSGAENVFSVRVQDVFGNHLCLMPDLCSLPPIPKITLVSPNSNVVRCQTMFKQEESLFECRYTATVAAVYTVSVLMSNRRIKFNTDNIITVLPAQPSAQNVLFSLKSEYNSGPFSFLLQARDAYSNNISTGGESIQVQ